MFGRRGAVIAHIGIVVVLWASAPYAAAQQESGPPADLDAQLRDIRGPVEYPAQWRMGRVAAALAALTAVSALLAFTAVRAAQRKAPAAPSRPEPAVRPGAFAIRRLQALQESGLWENGVNGVFADQFSSILREFAGVALAPDSHGQTTAELVRLLQRDGHAEAAGELQDLLRSCDLAKFAQQGMSPGSPIPRAIAWVSEVDAGSGEGASR